MKKEATELLIVGGPDKLGLAAALLGPENAVLRFEAINYEYLVDVTVLSFEQTEVGQLKISGTLQHADGVFRANSKASKYNCSGVYEYEQKRGVLLVEELSGDGLIEVERLRLDKAVVSEAVECIEKLDGNLSSILNDLQEKRAVFSKNTLSINRAAILNQQIRFIEGTVNGLRKIRRDILTEYADWL